MYKKLIMRLINLFCLVAGLGVETHARRHPRSRPTTQPPTPTPPPARGSARRLRAERDCLGVHRLGCTHEGKRGTAEAGPHALLYMLVTLPTFHADRFPLKALAS